MYIHILFCSIMCCHFWFHRFGILGPMFGISNVPQLVRWRWPMAWFLPCFWGRKDNFWKLALGVPDPLEKERWGRTIGSINRKLGKDRKNSCCWIAHIQVPTFKSSWGILLSIVERMHFWAWACKTLCSNPMIILAVKPPSSQLPKPDLQTLHRLCERGIAWHLARFVSDREV